MAGGYQRQFGDYDDLPPTFRNYLKRVSELVGRTRDDRIRRAGPRGDHCSRKPADGDEGPTMAWKHVDNQGHVT
jgi:hypothetical protein